MAPYFIPSKQFDKDEDGLPCSDTKGHDCLDFLKTITGFEAREDTSFDVDEYECTVCGDRFSEEQVERMYNPDPVKVKLPSGIVPELAAYTGAECAACGSERKSVVTERILAHTPNTVCCDVA